MVECEAHKRKTPFQNVLVYKYELLAEAERNIYTYVK